VSPYWRLRASAPLILLDLLFGIVLKGVLVLVVLQFLGSRISLYCFAPPASRMSRSIARNPDAPSSAAVCGQPATQVRAVSA
jgi:hypothetical protein